MKLPRGVLIVLIALATYRAIVFLHGLSIYNDIAQAYGYDWILRPHLSEWPWYVLNLIGGLFVLAGSITFLAMRWKVGFWLTLVGLGLSLLNAADYVGWFLFFGTPGIIESEMPRIREQLFWMAFEAAAGLYLLRHRDVGKLQAS